MANMSLKIESRANKALLRELPFSNLWPAQFNNLFKNSSFNTNSFLPTKKDLDRLTSIHDLDLFNLNTHEKRSNNLDDNYYLQITRCKYYSPHSFNQLKETFNVSTDCYNKFSLLHNNIRSLKKNLENLQTHLLDELAYHFDVIGVTETRIKQDAFIDFNPSMPNYNFEFVHTPLAAGGVGMYTDRSLKYKILEKSSNESYQALWIEIQSPKNANIICGVIYRQHNSPERFLTYFEETIEKLSASGKPIYLMGDFNINLLRSETCNHAQNFILSMQCFNLMPTIDKPTRVHNDSATLIDNIFVSKLENNITWEDINKLINRKKQSTRPISSLKCPISNRVIYDESKFIFNKYFSSVGHNLASKMPNSQIPFTNYLPKINNPGSFQFNPIMPHEIEIEIMSIPMKKAHGLYSCPTRILKCARHILSNPLSDLMNKSVECGQYPAKLKQSKVIPIYKKNDETDPSNYRPISLLSIFNKIFEKLMYNRLKSFFEKQNIIFKSQYGFREKYSTQHAILDIVNQVQSNKSRKLFTCGIFIDLQKAFDTVNYSILLEKLHHYGIRGIINDWFSSYLYQLVL